jgi:hypothetical protein
MQEFNVAQIVGAPEFGLFALEQLLFAAVQVMPQLKRLASDDDATSTPDRLALSRLETLDFRIHLPGGLAGRSVGASILIHFLSVQETPVQKRRHNNCLLGANYGGLFGLEHDLSRAAFAVAFGLQCLSSTGSAVHRFPCSALVRRLGFRLKGNPGGRLKPATARSLMAKSSESCSGSRASERPSQSRAVS